MILGGNWDYARIEKMSHECKVAYFIDFFMLIPALQKKYFGISNTLIWENTRLRIQILVISLGFSIF
jgi:hypothetical protein